MTDLLLVFLRAPRLGTVKTRLALGIGAPQALVIYRDLVERVLSAIPSSMNVRLCFTPDDAAPEIQVWVRPGWSLLPQGEGDLGTRLTQAIGQAFQEGVQGVVVIGTDAPEMTGTDLEEAFVALRDSDLVLGPATDGGYWLIGLTQPRPSLFTRIQWGESEVLNATEAAAALEGLSIRRLRCLSDLDTAADWEAWQMRAGLGA